MKYKFILKEGIITINDENVSRRFFKHYRNDGIIEINPNSHGALHKFKDLCKFDSLIRALFWSCGVEPLSYCKESVLKFDNIDNANKFLESSFNLIKKHNYKGHISNSVLGTEYYKYLPKGFVEIRIDKKFYHYIYDFTTFKFTSFNFEPLYKKYYNNNLYNYNFTTKKIEPNKNNKTWV